jgi:hypothetical protein
MRMKNKKIKSKKRRKKKEIKKEGHYGQFTLYIVGRSSFAKYFSKMVLDSPENLLHEHRHS